VPRYDYVAVDPKASCDTCREGFEVTHGMGEPAPEACPDCGSPVKRSWKKAPYVSGGRWSSKRLLDKDNLHKHGFKTGTDLLEETDSK
jgi:hypothetical protein